LASTFDLSFEHAADADARTRVCSREKNTMAYHLRDHRALKRARVVRERYAESTQSREPCNNSIALVTTPLSPSTTHMHTYHAQVLQHPFLKRSWDDAQAFGPVGGSAYAFHSLAKPMS